MRSGKLTTRICFLVLVLCCFLAGNGRGAEYVHHAQDLLDAGRRTDSVDALALDRYLSMAGRIPADGGLGVDFFLSGRFFYGFPVLSDYEVMRSDLFRFQGSVMLAWGFPGLLGNRLLEVYLGFHGVRYGLSTPVNLPLPEDDPVSTDLDVSDYVSDQFYDDLIELRLVSGGLGSLRLGWVQNEVYAATLDGRVERDESHLVARSERWVIEFEALSLLRFRYRMDAATRIDSWQVSTDIVGAFALWLASNQATSFPGALLENRNSPEVSRKSALGQGLPWISLALRAENYFRDASGSLRGSNEPNLVWEFEAAKRFNLSGGAWVQFDTTVGIFSRSWARWHDGNRLRELTLGVEFMIDLGVATPEDSLIALFINGHAPESGSIHMGYFFRYGSFTDAAIAVLAPDEGMTVSGYRIGMRMMFWNAFEFELSYAENDPADLKRFVESVGRGVFTFHLGYRY